MAEDCQRSILLLQGPQSPFNTELAAALARRGADVHQIVFNGGDQLLFRAPTTVAFKGAAGDWRGFVRDYMATHSVTDVLGYGDNRWFHVEAREEAGAAGVRFWALEEGYLRPNFITFEPHGNGLNSISLPDAGDIGGFTGEIPADTDLAWFKSVFLNQFYWTSAYHAALLWLWPHFRRYKHYRTISMWRDLGAWIRAFIRMARTRPFEPSAAAVLTKLGAGPLFVVPLQVNEDTQVRLYSDFPSVADFIDQVMRSFAAHAPPTAGLLIKHHPMDRGFHYYAPLVDATARALGIADRVVYGHDFHLPTLLADAAGCVTINSTVGLSALVNGVPTIAMGRAIYDIEGLTFGGDLDAFWGAPGTVDEARLERFRAALYVKTQINGSFYVDRHIAIRAIADRLMGQSAGATTS